MDRVRPVRGDDLGWIVAIVALGLWIVDGQLARVVWAMAVELASGLCGG